MHQFQSYLKPILLTCIIIFFTVPCAAYPSVETDRLTLLKLADTFTQKLKTEPTDAINHFNRGALYLRLGDNKQAEADFMQAIAIDDTLAIAYNNLAIIQLRNNNNNAALSLLNQAISLQPNLGEAYTNRGVVKFQSGQYDEALLNFNLAASIKPSCAGAFANRGILYALNGKLSAAGNDFDKAIAVNRYAPMFFYNRGVLRQAQKKYNEAFTDFNNVREGQAAASTYYHLGQIALAFSNHNQAIEHFDTAVSLGLDLKTVNLNKGYLLQTALSPTQIKPFKQIASIDYESFHPFGGRYSFSIRWLPNQEKYIESFKNKSEEPGNYDIPTENIAAFAQALATIHPEEWPSYYPPVIFDQPYCRLNIQFMDGYTVGFSGYEQPPYYRELEHFISKYLRTAKIEN